MDAYHATGRPGSMLRPNADRATPEGRRAVSGAVLPTSRTAAPPWAAAACLRPLHPAPVTGPTRAWAAGRLVAQPLTIAASLLLAGGIAVAAVGVPRARATPGPVAHVPVALAAPVGGALRQVPLVSAVSAADQALLAQLLAAPTAEDEALLASVLRAPAAAPAAAPILLNVGIIAGALWISPWFSEPVVGVAVGVLVGGILQVLLQIPWVLKKGFSLRPLWRPQHPAVKRIGLLMVPAVFGSAVYQMNQFVGTLLASFLPQGSISWLYYADRIVEFPLGVFAIAVSTAALPSLSSQVAGKDLSDFRETLGHALRLVFFYHHAGHRRDDPPPGAYPRGVLSERGVRPLDDPDDG